MSITYLEQLNEQIERIFHGASFPSARCPQRLFCAFPSGYYNGPTPQRRLRRVDPSPAAGLPEVRAAVAASIAERYGVPATAGPASPMRSPGSDSDLE